MHSSVGAFVLTFNDLFFNDSLTFFAFVSIISPLYAFTTKCVTKTLSFLIYNNISSAFLKKIDYVCCQIV